MGINEGSYEKIKWYIQAKFKRFVNAFSINSISAKTSIEIIQKIAIKKKIDEVYIHFALSLDLVKDTIISSKDNIIFCDLTLLRTCSIDALNTKYKQLSTVKTTAFLYQKTNDQ